MMKKLILSLFLLSTTISSFAQDTDEMMQKIEESGYIVDDNGHVTYTKIFDAPEASAVDIYKRAKDFFVYNYGSGKAVIQSEDEDKHSIVGKGIYPCEMSLSKNKVWHIVRIDAKDGKARVTISLQNYDITHGGSYPVSDCYPINKEGKYKGYKKIMIKCFYKIYNDINGTFSKINAAIQNKSSIPSNDENW